MIRRGIAQTLALSSLCAVALIAIACGSSADTSTEPNATAATETADSESAPAPTAAVGPRGEGLPPGFAPEGRTGAPGLGRGTRFVPLDNPAFVSADEATFLTPDDRVLGVAIGVESRAYPISMMTFHHVANDELAGLPVLVTF